MEQTNKSKQTYNKRHARIQFCNTHSICDNVCWVSIAKSIVHSRCVHIPASIICYWQMQEIIKISCPCHVILSTNTHTQVVMMQCHCKKTNTITNLVANIKIILILVPKDQQLVSNSHLNGRHQSHFVDGIHVSALTTNRNSRVTLQTLLTLNKCPKY